MNLTDVDFEEYSKKNGTVEFKGKEYALTENQFKEIEKEIEKIGYVDTADGSSACDWDNPIDVEML